MYIYKAIDRETFHVINEIFSTLEAATQFAQVNINKHRDARIDPILGGIMDGIKIEKDLDEEINCDWIPLSSKSQINIGSRVRKGFGTPEDGFWTEYEVIKIEEDKFKVKYKKTNQSVLPNDQQGDKNINYFDLSNLALTVCM